MDAIHQLNATLDGSPYLLEADEQGQKRAKFLLEQCVAIERRELEVRELLLSQSDELRRRLDTITEARAVFESNALELTGLALSDTEAEIESAPAELDELKEYVARRVVTADRHLLDVLGLHQANQFARMLAHDFAKESRPIREVDLRALHRFTVPGEDFAGSYRVGDVRISGSRHVPPTGVDVPRQMHDLVDWLDSTTSLPPLAACVVHSWLTIVHPFEDGNGRLARLLANVVLMRAGWPTLIIRASDRLQYLDALSASDAGGNLLPLFDLFVKSMRRGLRELEKPGLAERLFRVDLQKDPDQRFKIWAQQLTEFIDELRSGIRDGGFTLDRLAVPPASTLFLLEEREAAGNTWLAKIRHADGRDYLLWLGHMSTTMLDAAGLDRPAPSLFIASRDRRPEALHPYTNIRDGSPVPIDEISLVPGIGPRQALVRHGTYVDGSEIGSAAAVLAEALQRTSL